MTEYEKLIAAEMRARNICCTQIAEKLGLSVNTVKSFCRRNHLKKEGAVCLNCGAAIPRKEGRSRRKFCSDSCKTEWWNQHRQERRSKNICEYTCVVCGKKFYDYIGAHRKYCSRTCFGKRGAGSGQSVF